MRKKNMITINDQIAPFSHIPGSVSYIPGSYLAARIFPSFVEFYDLRIGYKEPIAYLRIENLGPLHDFTIILDLEKGKIIVRGLSSQGFCSYEIKSTNPFQCELHFLKIPEDVSVFCEGRSLTPSLCTFAIAKQQIAKGSYFLCELTKNENSIVKPSIHRSRVHLGCHKQQDIDAIRKRNDLQESFPLWYSLSQWVPQCIENYTPENSLISDLQEAICLQNKAKVETCLRNIFTLGFKGLMAVKAHDDDFLGYDKVAFSQSHQAALYTLKESFTLLTSLFLDKKMNSVSILPCVPTVFHAGRIIGIECNGQVFDIEWTKKTCRRVAIHCQSTCRFPLQFPSDIKSLRLRQLESKQDYVVDAANLELEIEEHKTYLLDNFKK